MLTSQIRDHFQLLVHVFLLSRVQSFQKGLTDCPAQVGCWDLLRDLYQKTLDSNAKYQAAITPTPNSLTIVNKSVRKPVYDIPGIDMLPNLYNFALIDQQPSLGSLNAMLALFKPFFNTRYTINIHSFTDEANKKEGKVKGPVAPPSRLKFTPAEDSLLAIGLEKFGSSKWNLIKQYLLPTKTESQIMNRYKNRSSKSAEENPIKAYKISKNTPLSNEEIQLLYEGIRYYGFQWDLIASKLLPHRQSSVLAKAYRRLQKELNSDNNNNDPKTKKQKTSGEYSDSNLSINQNFLRDTNINVNTPPKINTSNSSSSISPSVLPTLVPNVDTVIKLQDTIDNSNSVFYTSEGIPFTLADLQFNEETDNNNVIIREDAVLQSSDFESSSDESFERIELNDSLEKSLQCEEKWSEIEATPPIAIAPKSDNKLVVDGVDIVFQKAEDAAILNAVKASGASSLTWQGLLLDGMNKTEHQIAERYQQLLSLMKQRTANKS